MSVINLKDALSMNKDWQIISISRGLILFMMQDNFNFLQYSV